MDVLHFLGNALLVLLCVAVACGIIFLLVKCAIALGAIVCAFWPIGMAGAGSSYLWHSGHDNQAVCVAIAGIILQGLWFWKLHKSTPAKIPDDPFERSNDRDAQVTLYDKDKKIIGYKDRE